MKYFKVYSVENNKLEQNVPFQDEDYKFFLSICNGGQVLGDETFNYLNLTLNTKTGEFLSGLLSFLPYLKTEKDISINFDYAKTILYQDWFYTDEEQPYSANLLPFAEDNTNFYCFDNNRGGEIRYFDMSFTYFENLEEFNVIANCFSEFLEKLISQNDGYIKNLSEILEKIKSD